VKRQAVRFHHSTHHLSSAEVFLYYVVVIEQRLCCCRRLESTESLLEKHVLAKAPDLEARLTLWDQKQVRSFICFVNQWHLGPEAGAQNSCAYTDRVLSTRVLSTSGIWVAPSALQGSTMSSKNVFCACMCAVHNHKQWAMGNGQWAMPEAYHVPEYSALLGTNAPGTQDLY